ncbi:ankyrin repeat domain-containing protein [Bacillus suaedae]|uniref:Ankyrin repeat domain-containing protein n=1 Tax=Halalkalibacter suaedae TaxID=2822140 RepID=A0A940WWF7_9BACI|nr:ankyrin repeat domain-containing protein [Bacillus suaedae]MBP3951757.1 ankyrin repeat domain-containing protein [Bacillus suaedae]
MFQKLISKYKRFFHRNNQDSAQVQADNESIEKRIQQEVDKRVEQEVGLRLQQELEKRTVKENEVLDIFREKVQIPESKTSHNNISSLFQQEKQLQQEETVRIQKPEQETQTRVERQRKLREAQQERYLLQMKERLREELEEKERLEEEQRKKRIEEERKKKLEEEQQKQRQEDERRRKLEKANRVRIENERREKEAWKQLEERKEREKKQQLLEQQRIELEKQRQAQLDLERKEKLEREKERIAKELEEEKERIEKLARDQGLTYVGHITELMRAAENNDLDLVRTLIDDGANVNECNRQIETPLIYALKSIQKGSFAQVVELLLLNGANPHVKTRNDVTAFMYAESRKDQASMDILLQFGAEQKSYNREQSTDKLTNQTEASQKAQPKVVSFEERLARSKKFFPEDDAFERQFLKHTIQKLDEKIKHYTRPKYFRGNPANAGNLDRFDPVENAYYNKIADSLKPLRSRPYFGRIDVKGETRETFYIGESSIGDRVISWTAPAASIFYEKRLGMVQHYTLGNVFVGRIRQYDIKGGSMISMSDYNGHVDPILEQALKTNKGHEMTTIVETIQGEQDRIIRLPKNQNVIVQGSAGSGKTAIALHRIAYLFFRYNDLKASNLVIFGPNEIFLQHIKNVIPSLQVWDVVQTSFHKWAADQHLKLSKIPDPQTIFNRLDKIKDSNKKSELSVILSFKGSYLFRDAVEEYYKQYEKTFAPSEPFEFKTDQGSFVLSVEEFSKKFKALDYLPLAKRVSNIESIVMLEFQKWQNSKNQVEIRACQKQFKRYLGQIKSLKPINIYTEFLGSTQLSPYFPESFENRPVDLLLKMGKENHIFNPNQIVSEDLAALMHLKMLLHGLSEDEKFQYTVIDEAQDYSPYDLWVISQFTAKNSLMLLGDLGQGLYSYRGLQNWENVNNVINSPSYIELEMTYRSTKQITELGNDIISSFSEGRYRPSKPTFRNGPRPEVYICHSTELMHEMLYQKIVTAAESFKTIAVITRNESEARNVYGILNQQLNCVLVTDDKQNQVEKVTIIPVHLTKGLEYDAVLMYQPTEENYMNESTDQKLLYVACTRALHELSLFSTLPLSRYLIQSIDNDNLQVVTE